MNKRHIGLLMIKLAYYVVAISGTIFAFTVDVMLGFIVLVLSLLLTCINLSLGK